MRLCPRGNSNFRRTIEGDRTGAAKNEDRPRQPLVKVEGIAGHVAATSGHAHVVDGLCPG